MQSKYSYLHSKVNSLLKYNRLFEVFSLLSSSISSKTDSSITDLLKKQEETYKFLIHYLVEGFEDNDREKMIDEIKTNLYLINDAVLRSNISIDSSDSYSSSLRLIKLRKSSLSSLYESYNKAFTVASLAIEAGIIDYESQKIADEALNDLFSYVWTMFGAPASEYETLSSILVDNNNSFDLKCQIISALLLGNLSFFDRKGFLTLLSLYDADVDNRITARALVAIILIMSAHLDKIACDQKIIQRLSVHKDSILSYRQLREVMINLLRSFDTKRITDKMKNEVLPELMKLRPEILKRLGKMQDINEFDALEINPEWENLIGDNELTDKLKDLSEIQMEGGDVMMLAFSNLKSFPFFNAVPNWFLPFSINHHEIDDLSRNNLNSFNEILELEGVICDSDKFSFALSLAKMPKAQIDMISQQMNEQFQQMKEAFSEKKLKSSVPEFDMEISRYVRDLYRFFKLYRRHEDFYDPFNNPIEFDKLPIFGEILSDIDILNLVAEFYFKHKYYSEALGVYLKINSYNNQDPSIWEKIGFCYNSLDMIESALVWYKKAELLNPESKWLIRKIATCCRLIGKFNDAADYYAKALTSDPDNYGLLMNVGHTFLELKNYKAALENYYHAEYVKPEKISTWRAIAWTELLNDNKGKSLAYYKKILDSEEKSFTDYINSGHLFYLTGDLKKAVSLYNDASVMKEDGLKKVIDAITEDRHILINAGGKENEISLILDKLRYDLRPQS